jgi:predicted dehydrogenase
LIIGLGRAGERFLQALRFIEASEGSVRLVGVCDVEPGRLAKAPEGVPVYTDAREALLASEAEVVGVTVNEYYHHSVLSLVREVSPATTIVLSEKPLTHTLEECRDLRGLYGTEEIAVNFCERFSPIVNDFREWFAENSDLELLRAEFFWGKYRLNDPRHTIGDISEISHPLDLTRVLAGLPSDVPVQLKRAMGTSSDFNPHGPKLLDTLDVQLTLDSKLVVVGHSSFLWDQRMRRIVLYGRFAGDGRLCQVLLDFDNPRWDVDRLVIAGIDAAGGDRTVVFETNYDHSDFPPELFKIAKVHAFIAAALGAPGAATDLVADFDCAFWVQSLIEGIQQMTIVDDPLAVAFSPAVQAAGA